MENLNIWRWAVFQRPDGHVRFHENSFIDSEVFRREYRPAVILYHRFIP
jgi:hypothetical protein